MGRPSQEGLPLFLLKVAFRSRSPYPIPRPGDGTGGKAGSGEATRGAVDAEEGAQAREIRGPKPGARAKKVAEEGVRPGVAVRGKTGSLSRVRDEGSNVGIPVGGAVARRAALLAHVRAAEAVLQAVLRQVSLDLVVAPLPSQGT